MFSQIHQPLSSSMNIMIMYLPVVLCQPRLILYLSWVLILQMHLRNKLLPSPVWELDKSIFHINMRKGKHDHTCQFNVPNLAHPTIYFLTISYNDVLALYVSIYSIYFFFLTQLQRRGIAWELKWKEVNTVYLRFLEPEWELSHYSFFQEKHWGNINTAQSYLAVALAQWIATLVQAIVKAPESTLHCCKQAVLAGWPVPAGRWWRQISHWLGQGRGSVAGGCFEDRKGCFGAGEGGMKEGQVWRGDGIGRGLHHIINSLLGLVTLHWAAWICASYIAP